MNFGDPLVCAACDDKSSLLNIFEYPVAGTVPSGGVASLRKVLGVRKCRSANQVSD